MWLHAKDMPGSHVIICTEGEVPPTTLKQAAQLAAWYSKGQRSSSVPVDYTLRKYVKKPRRGTARLRSLHQPAHGLYDRGGKRHPRHYPAGRINAKRKGERNIWYIFGAVRESDAAALAELRRPYAEKYPAKAPDAGSILREIRRLTTAYPYLVAEVNDQVVGLRLCRSPAGRSRLPVGCGSTYLLRRGISRAGFGVRADAAAHAGADGSGLCACMCHGGPAQRCGAGFS